MLDIVNGDLADTLFRLISPVRLPPEPVRDMQQAALNARERWPELAEMVDAAVRLVGEDCLYKLVGEPTMLALCRPEDAWRGRLVSLTATGLGCTCDAWPPVKQAGPGDGLYCQDILAVLLHVYLDRQLHPLPHSPEALWQEALSELQHQMARATFTNWLAGSRAVPEASSPLLLTVEVHSQYAQEWLTHRLLPVIAQTVAGIAGYPLKIHFVTSMRSPQSRTKETLS